MKCAYGPLLLRPPFTVSARNRRLPGHSTPATARTATGAFPTDARDCGAAQVAMCQLAVKITLSRVRDRNSLSAAVPKATAVIDPMGSHYLVF